ncbi:MAG: hypothetical protein ACK4TP_04820 [Hyphomicrobium sp.]
MQKVVEHNIVQQPKRPGEMISGGGDGTLTVGDLRNAIAYLDDTVEITFGGDLIFYRFKWRGEDLLQIELNNADM